MKIYGRTTLRLQYYLCCAQNFIHTAGKTSLIQSNPYSTETM